MPARAVRDLEFGRRSVDNLIDNKNRILLIKFLTGL
jgi:hypothetical protein